MYVRHTAQCDRGMRLWAAVFIKKAEECLFLNFKDEYIVFYEHKRNGGVESFRWPDLQQ